MEYSNLKKYFWNFYSPSLLPYHRFLSIVVIWGYQDSVQLEICFGVLLPSYTFYPKKYLNFSKKEKSLALEIVTWLL